ncbi:hypothetical protein BH18ACT4_BH18ACT4_14880 [soil metagenome]
MTVKARTASVDETRALAAALAELARPDDIIVLAGDLGSGKTAFAQGFGRGLGVTVPITSPTFTLARHYEGRLGLHHLDVYRLEQMSEVFDMGLPELLDEGAVTLIEWGDAIIPALPAEFLEVRLAFPDDGPDDAPDDAPDERPHSGTDERPDERPDDVRELSLRPVGPVWAVRHRAIAAALAPWVDQERTGP